MGEWGSTEDGARGAAPLGRWGAGAARRRSRRQGAFASLRSALCISELLDRPWRAAGRSCSRCWAQRRSRPPSSSPGACRSLRLPWRLCNPRLRGPSPSTAAARAPLVRCRLLEFAGSCDNTASGRWARDPAGRWASAPSCTAAAPTRRRRRSAAPSPAGPSPRWYITDDKGYVCARDAFNYGTGCCTSGELHSCERCAAAAAAVLPCCDLGVV